MASVPRFVMTALLLAAACGAAGGGARTGGDPTALLTGDTCALHTDGTSCRADLQGCAWYPNTRACLVGQPCPAGWCYLAQSSGGSASGGGGGAVSASCACSGGADDVCVQQVGGPAVQAGTPPSITCAPRPSSCAAADPCACLAQGPIERCASSAQVANLCLCDSGAR